METEMSFSSASTTWLTAAIALPPQIAVPTEIKYEIMRSTLKILPSKKPTPMAIEMVRTVKTNPSFPASTTLVKFIPKPSPTIAPCNKYLMTTFDCFGKGFPKIIPINKPSINAVLAENEKIRISTIPAMNDGLASFSFNKLVFSSGFSILT